MGGILRLGAGPERAGSHLLSIPGGPRPLPCLSRTNGQSSSSCTHSLFHPGCRAHAYPLEFKYDSLFVGSTSFGSDERLATSVDIPKDLDAQEGNGRTSKWNMMTNSDAILGSLEIEANVTTIYHTVNAPLP